MSPLLQMTKQGVPAACGTELGLLTAGVETAAHAPI